MNIISLCGCIEMSIPEFKACEGYSLFTATFCKQAKRHYNSNQNCWQKAKADFMWLQRENRSLTSTKTYGKIENEIRAQIDFYIPELKTFQYSLSVEIYQGTVRDILQVNIRIKDTKVNFIVR